MEQTTLIAIERRFPGLRAIVQREYSQSESFRGLCRDFVACQAALARWQETESEEGRLRSEEYSDLLAELTAEVETHLYAHES